ncbi:hypothetical protein G5B38_00475 [Pseudohalocynthiibacter aestuariivivens]|nr:hypothetical protein [Pseudohalocynthiibacter aestuariivivens]QIE44122.1 hypothetical protein G5B38_00475 [Pseudohalocynthiibacter aestuariivivens]
MIARFLILTSLMAAPALAVDAARMDALLDVARAQGCVIADLDATLKAEGFTDEVEASAIIGKLEDEQKASRVGPSLLVRGDACMQGSGPTELERFMAVMGRGDNCTQPVDGLNYKMEGYGLTPAQVGLLREELEGNGEATLSADGESLQIEAAQCAAAQDLARSITPDPEQAFLAFMASHDCRMGKRDQNLEIANAGLDPVATDIVIEKLVSEGAAIYYGPDESLIVFNEHCR